STALALTITMDSAGDFYIDDLSLVAGTVAATGPNLLQNGDFETGSLPTWQALGNHSASTVSTAIKHSGNASLHVLASNAGSVPANTLVQSNDTLIQSNVHTLSF